MRRAVGALYGVAAIGMLGAGAAGLPAAPALASGPGTPPPDATLISVNASAKLEGVTISVDRVALDPGARATWFEVTASNSGPLEADWPGVPVASIGAMNLSVDYFRSTHLPGDIDAGQSATGWLLVALDPAKIHPSDPVLLRFQDVAVDNYRTVQDVDVSVDMGTASSTG